MRRIRNPRYAPESLERRLNPSTYAGGMVAAEVATMSPPGVTDPAPAAADLSPGAELTVEFSTFVDPTALDALSTADPGSDDPFGNDPGLQDVFDVSQDPDPEPAPDPMPDPYPEPGPGPDEPVIPGVDPTDPPFVPLPPAPIGPAGPG
jgi:hypothetical protein